MDALSIIELCQRVYYSPTITAGPADIDGASIVRVGNETALVFRGTVCTDVASPATAFLDWLTDAHRELVTRPEFPGRVHEGFYGDLMALWVKLQKWDWSPGSVSQSKLTITGHSKGGSLAVLAGWLLRALKPTVVTFGAPRVGDSYFSAAWVTSGPAVCASYVNPHDLVPKLPLVGYDRVGQTILPPATWQAPRGPIANHHLTTYAEWCRLLDGPPPAAAQRRAA